MPLLRDRHGKAITDRLRGLAFLLIAILSLSALFACSAPPSDASAAPSGSPMPAIPPIVTPTDPASSPSAVIGNGAAMDAGHASDGGIFVARLLPDAPEARHKLTVSCGQMTYAYDLAADGTPLVVPANMGNGHYSVDVMRCIHDNDYVSVLSMETDVSLPSEFTPFLCPNVFCDYAEDDACVARAREMAASCENQGEFAARACEFVMETVEYDHGKAESVGKGYVPAPDATIAEGKGICFDYASLLAATFRSVGIPAKVVTGNLRPNGEYHAWVEAYVDGSWQGYGMSVESGTWSRLDVTIADEGVLYEVEGYNPRYEY